MAYLSVSVAAAVDGDDVVVDIDYGGDAPAMFVVISVDGEFLSQSNQPGGHTWDRRPDGETVTLLGSLYHPEPGTADVWVTLYPDEDPANRFDFETTVAVGGTPSPFILPTVPSGQALFQTVARSVFGTSPPDLDGYENPATYNAIYAQFLADGVTHAECATFVHPADYPDFPNPEGWNTFDEWRAAFHYLIVRRAEAARDAGMRIIGIGEFVRYPYQNDAFLDPLPGYEWIWDALDYAADWWRDFGLCDGVRMVDEVQGVEDHPAGPAVVERWRSRGGPPLAWPNAQPLEWETPELSDYSARQGDPNVFVYQQLKSDLTSSLWQFKKLVTDLSGTNLRRDVPASMILPVTGAYYQKLAEGDEYQPGVDHLHAGITRPEMITSAAWLYLAHGFSRFDVYHYHHTHWRNANASAEIGQAYLQTGGQPGDHRWDNGLAKAFRSIADRETQLYATPYVPTTSGPWVFGRRGGLVWGVNTAERTLPSPNGPGMVLAAESEVVEGSVPSGDVVFWDRPEPAPKPRPKPGPRPKPKPRPRPPKKDESAVVR